MYIIYVSVGWKDYARRGKTLTRNFFSSRKKLLFQTLEYIPENEPATKDFTTGLLTNTSILVLILFWCYCLDIFSSFCFSRFFFFSRVSYFSHTVLRALFTFLNCLLYINLRWVPVPIREIGVGNGERLEQFHVTIHLAIIDTIKQFVLHVHDVHTISSYEISFTIRLFGHWG